MNLGSLGSVSNSVELDEGVPAKKFGQECEDEDCVGCGESGGTSSLRFSGTYEEMAKAPRVGVIPAWHEWVPCPPYLATVSSPVPSFSLSLPLPLLCVDLGGDSNISFSLSRCSAVSSTAYAPFHEASNTLANQDKLPLDACCLAFTNDWHCAVVLA